MAERPKNGHLNGKTKVGINGSPKGDLDWLASGHGVDPASLDEETRIYARKLGSERVNILVDENAETVIYRGVRQSRDAVARAASSLLRLSKNELKEWGQIRPEQEDEDVLANLSLEGGSPDWENWDYDNNKNEEPPDIIEILTSKGAKDMPEGWVQDEEKEFADILDLL